MLVNGIIMLVYIYLLGTKFIDVFGLVLTKLEDFKVIVRI
jgi:hypothetical protein